jgi:Kdo2-lipid IVA lauroyltransferase/acyltransferase
LKPAAAAKGDGRRATFRDRLEYVAFRAITGACLALGPPRDQRAALQLGRVIHRVVGVRRDVVHSNLRHAFPERPEEWLDSVAEAAYAHLARETIATLRLRRSGPGEIEGRTRLTGLDAVRTALDAGRGAIVVTGHFGNWELGLHAVASRGVAADAVYKHQRNPLFDRLLTDGRERFGVQAFDRAEAPRATLRSLRQNRVVFFVADQNAGPNGVFVPFFGRLASTHRGPALLAVRTGAPLFAARALRADEARYDILLEEIHTPREGEPDDAVRRLTADYTAWLETEIRQAPEQYFWLHRRWKTRPATEAK